MYNLIDKIALNYRAPSRRENGQGRDPDCAVGCSNRRSYPQIQ